MYPVLVGDIDPIGNLNANVIHQFTDRIRGKLATQVQRNKFTAVQMTADYRGDYYTMSLTLGNPDIINNSGKNSK
jgi:mitochondrial import receptor subunit TOM40